MIVYDSRNKRYVLSTTSAGQDQNGAMYYAQGEPDIMVKIYHPQFRNPSTERDVIDSINGVRSMLNEMPLDVVYQNGKFAGYIYQKSSPVPFPIPDPVPFPGPERTPAPDGLLVLIGIGIGLAMSALVYLVLFRILANSFAEEYIFWNFNGIPMILVGWAVMFLVIIKTAKSGFVSLAYGALGFLLGGIVVFFLICALVYMFSAAASIVKLLLPTIITIAVVVWLLKLFLKH